MRSWNAQRRTTLLAVSAVVLLTAACSSANKQTGDSGVSGGGGSANNSSRGVSDDSIKIAGDLSETLGGNPTGNADVDLGTKARFYVTNQAGGINGRKINYIGSVDDGGSAATLLANVRKQVLDQKVFAISPFDTYAPVDASFFNDQSVPTFGDIISYAACGSKWFFGSDGCVENPTFAETTSVAAIAQYMTGKAPDPTTGAITAPVASDNPPPAGNSYAVITSSNLAQIIPTLKVAAKHVGWDACDYNATVPPSGVTDFSSFAGSIMRSCDGGKGPSVMLYVLPSTQYNVNMLRAMRGLGWKGQAEFAGFDPASLQSADLAPTLEGSIYYDDGVGFEGPDNKATYDQIRSALAGVGKPGTTISQGILAGWQSADLIVQGLTKVGKDLTPANLDKVLNSGWDTPGIAGFSSALSFPTSHTHPAPCWNIAKVESGKYVQATTFTCGQVLNSKTGAVVSGGAAK
ncbi:MAG: Branched-chain amino acid transporter, amino acid-binding protein [Frankiales bacterium]|nr:Branched-chain amino acid transporter, amino acid-binding protein [Frankiales bacterium]